MPLSADRRTAVAAETAKMLIDSKAVLFADGEPFTFTSGTRSPVYVDMRRIISFPNVRARLVDMAIETMEEHVGSAKFDVVAGGETAGIPFAAWMSERMALPMQYVRKKPKGFGRDARIEGVVQPDSNVLLVEDLATDAGSKVGFVEAIRESGQRCSHAFVFFFYDIFPKAIETMKALDVELHYLVTWHDVLRVARDEHYFSDERLDAVEAFLKAPTEWSVARGGPAS